MVWSERNGILAVAIIFVVSNAIYIEFQRISTSLGWFRTKNFVCLWGFGSGKFNFCLQIVLFKRILLVNASSNMKKIMNKLDTQKENFKSLSLESSPKFSTLSIKPLHFPFLHLHAIIHLPCSFEWHCKKGKYSIKTSHSQSPRINLNFIFPLSQSFREFSFSSLKKSKSLLEKEALSKKGWKPKTNTLPQKRDQKISQLNSYLNFFRELLDSSLNIKIFSSQTRI